jgi:DNA polymerase lambda
MMILIIYYYLEKEFKDRIPREEVKMLQKVVKNVICTIDKNLKAVTCGSYRRGAKDCGDIDILVTHRKGDDTTGLLKKIIDLLHKYNFLSDDLVTIKEQRECSSSSSSSSQSEVKVQNKYMGVCVLPPPKGSGLHRRIDIQVIPLEEWPFALLYFTGSAHFNRSMRLWARKNNYSLSEKSLVYRFTSPKRAGNTHSPSGEFKGEPLKLSSEREIFEALKLTYKPPIDRNL